MFVLVRFLATSPPRLRPEDAPVAQATGSHGMTITETRECEIIVNGERLVTAAASLADLVTAQGFADVKVATAVNGDFVPARARADLRLAAGDRVEILTVRQGG